MRIFSVAIKHVAGFSSFRKTVLLLSFGFACGLFFYFNVYANTPYYLSNESGMCVQCHVMESQFATWNHSAHRQYVQCGDCHLPHHNPVAKYAVKARDGIKDLTLFMLRMEKNIPHSTAATKEIIRGNCLRCHEKAMAEVDIAAFYTGRWSLLGPEIVNPIGCADCHDHETMNLVITRPALIEAFQRMGKDISKATHQEMRSLVCAQCHVEYYFDKRPDGSEYLTHPWDKGMSVESMEAYYDKLEFADWTHTFSRAPMLKGQHPDYEIYTTGVHATRGVACADCHMPYTVEGSQKFSDHHVQSPLNNVANSCQACHREETEQLVADVYERQERIIQNRDALEKLLVRAHVEARTAWEKGATEKDMADILTLIRHAQWRWDYVAASHGASFHSPVETSRIIATAIEKAQECRVKLARVLTRLGIEKEIPYPDIDTKAKAQQYIGLPIEKLILEKQAFKEKLLPRWLAEAEKREKKWKKEII